MFEVVYKVCLKYGVYYTEDVKYEICPNILALSTKFLRL
jgi:hypothetical protein